MTADADFPRQGPSVSTPVPVFKRRLFGLMSMAVLALAGWSGFAAWRHVAPPAAAPGWAYQTLHVNLPRVSALALGPADKLFVSLESRKGDGIILTITENGDRDEVLGSLHKPDGLVAFKGGIAVTQEDQNEPVIWWHNDVATRLFEANDAEGIVSDGNFLYVIEDQQGSGRLLRYDSDSRELMVLREGLDEAEGVAVCPNGDVFYLEKSSERVRRLAADGQDPVVVDGLNKPGFLLCRPEGLWITEDATHGARLLLFDHQSRLQVVLRHLRAPQTLLSVGPDRYLLAEQGRDRILEIWHKPGATGEAGVPPK